MTGVLVRHLIALGLAVAAAYALAAAVGGSGVTALWITAGMALGIVAGLLSPGVISVLFVYIGLIVGTMVAIGVTAPTAADGFTVLGEHALGIAFAALAATVAYAVMALVMIRRRGPLMRSP